MSWLRHTINLETTEGVKEAVSWLREVRRLFRECDAHFQTIVKGADHERTMNLVAPKNIGRWIFKLLS